jgi:hypothetical protein
MVLELALCSDEPIMISEFGRSKMPGILQVSYKLRGKGSPIYYENNDFRAIITGGNPDGPTKWAKEIASDKLRLIPAFTFDYRLTPLDYRRFYLRLSRADEEKQWDTDGLYRMCRQARTKTLSGLRIIAAGMQSEPYNIRLSVRLLPDDIPYNLTFGARELAKFMSYPISELIVDVEEALTPPVITRPRPMKMMELERVTNKRRQQIASSIRRGRDMSNAYWDLVVT